MEHISLALDRAMVKVRRRPPLPPLDPDRFLVWAFYAEPDELRGDGPVTINDVVQATGGTVDQVRRTYIRIAARVRANMRIGRDPWEGVVR